MKKIKYMLAIIVLMVGCATLQMKNKITVIDKNDGEKFICENTTQNKNFQTYIRCMIEKNGQKYNCTINIKKDKIEFDIEQDCIIQIETKDNF